jgi:hypothetical protein
VPGSLPEGTRLERPPEGKALSVQPATTYVSIALATHIGCPLPNFLEFEVTSWSILTSPLPHSRELPLPQQQCTRLAVVYTITFRFSDSKRLLYPVVAHFPIDYFALFGYLTSFAFVLMLQIKALARESNTPT